MKDQKTVVQEALDYIEENLERALDLDIISKNVGYSKYYLNRIFAEHTGITIYKYLQNRRLTVAAEKLVRSNMPITQIAYEAGYDTPKQNKISMYCSHAPKNYNFTLKIKEVAA